MLLILRLLACDDIFANHRRDTVNRCCRGLASSRACSSGPIGTCSSNHGTEVVPGAARVDFGEDAKLNTYSARDGPPEIVEVNLPGRRSVDLRAAGYLNVSIAGGIGAGLDAGGFQDWQIVAIAICARRLVGFG